MDYRTTSAEVTRWGSRWLKKWVSEGETADARNVRAEVSEGWAAYTLDDWVRAATREPTGDSRARLLGHKHMVLYKGMLRNGLLVWRAYREYRSAGLPVPEEVLVRLDAYAAALETTERPEDVLEALELLTNVRGGPQGRTHLDQVERQRYVVAKYWGFRVLGLKPTAALRRAADELGISVSAVKSARQRWKKRDVLPIQARR